MPLESEPLRYTGHLLRRLQQLHLALWTKHVSSDISSVQFAALAVLERRPGASQREVGEELDIDRSTVADLVRRMADHGLIERALSDSDRRRNVLRLTAPGRAELERLRPLVVALEPLLTGALDDGERTDLRAMMQRMLEHGIHEGHLAGPDRRAAADG
ncbi:MarR family winged helix-turn-helix transcriptional regulator [Leucobacter allii]|uniref:MarR family winged helix-turn-helix transcriptional regulator n=1 Tax=Leucobacter allii TaxID=2932247 RepID=UPI001FD31687|nr:MarR family winged helix-turn-helix transcriptional regulator [Leucobacter allii]UOR01512.1 MarR family winged helix-turn-helix transcriptional regulator [Leucobacter allii]